MMTVTLGAKQREAASTHQWGAISWQQGDEGSSLTGHLTVNLHRPLKGPKREQLGKITHSKKSATF